MKTGAKVLLALALATGTAAAQKPAAAGADAALAEGRRLYELQEWDRAIVKFKEAYALRDDAPALFNIAQSYRLKGDCANAAHFYRTFKRKFPKEKNIAKVDKFIVEMEECAKTAPKPTEPVTPVPTEPPPTTTTTTPPPTTTVEPTTKPASPSTPTEPKKAGGTLRLTGLIVAGVGVASLGGGVFFGLRARSATTDAENLGPGDTWLPGIEERGESSASRAKLLLIGGGVAVAAGAVLFTLGSKRATENSAVSIVPSTEGASFVWSGGF